MKKSDVYQYYCMCIIGSILSMIAGFTFSNMGLFLLSAFYIVALILFVIGAIVSICIDDMSYSQFVRRYGRWD